ncbi:VPLPA-CTERM sorting domain-containing protein [Parasedimentitalea denitrificans]|uniref:VPLPA-CTERM sorting domain-containing protein n=1 Tax=Parasedimentitalea denitrificans TaxID=2211118 RepID=UPI001430C728|nr:VPLPA-CTERM sorting domain-containing protein [Sedimentitalea sp. CY04]
MGVAIATSFLAVTAQGALAASYYPTTLFDNTTGYADSLFLGAPDGNSGNIGSNWVGIGGQTVTYDFGPNLVLNGAGTDINVYEVNYGVPEFSSINVFASLDGITFSNISASMAAWVDIVGDEAHGAPSYAKSYDLGGLASARYIRIDGNGSGAAGGTSAFDLDAIAAINVQVSAVPLPAGLPLLFAGIGLLGFVGRKRRHS